jgi:hypothetical protein
MSGEAFKPNMRALILGHFSTVGDVDSLTYVTQMLREEGVAYDVVSYIEKLTPHIGKSVRRTDLDPSRYTHLVVVCGPFWPELLERRGIDLQRFAHCTRIGVNLTMIEPTGAWNPFHLLLERDSDRAVLPDLSFFEAPNRDPVAGLCVIDSQREYGDRQRHKDAVKLMRKLIEDRGIAAVEIDTRWPAFRNSGGLASAAQVASVIGRMDVMLTNRLHGLVYGLKCGVPVLAIDPVQGSGKVTLQADVLGWRAVSTVDEASPAWLEAMFDWCLSEDGRKAAGAVAAAAQAKLSPVSKQFREALRTEFPDLPLPPSPARRSPGPVQQLKNAIRKIRIGGR